MITDAKTPTETLSVAEAAQTVEYESVTPVFILGSGHSDRADLSVYLIHYVSESVGHDQVHNPS